MTNYEGAKVAKLKLREDMLAEYRRLSGLQNDVDLAKRVGVDPATIYRVLSGRTEMSAKFIAGMVETFGPKLFEHLFEVVSDADGEVAA